jgi:hypothetical protein
MRVIGGGTHTLAADLDALDTALAANPQEPSVIDRVLAVMEARPGAIVTPMLMAGALKISNKTASDALRELSLRGHVVRVGVGKYVREESRG